MKFSETWTILYAMFSDNIAIGSKNAGLRNERLVLWVLKQLGPLSQSQICQNTALGSSTVSYIVSRLRRKGLLHEKPGISNRPGVKPTVIEINPAGRFIIGVELNPTHLLIGQFDFMCDLIETVKINLDENVRFEQVINLLEINILGLLGKTGIKPDQIAGIGVTVSGSVSDNGDIVMSSPMGWKSVPLGFMMRSKFSCPVHVFTTKVRLLAEIEHQQNSSENILYLNVGNGVGTNVIIDGNLLHGATNNCGELGHIIFQPGGPQCGCGNRGCLEALISGPALYKKIRKDIKAGAQSCLSVSILSEDQPEDVIIKWGLAINQQDAYALEVRDFVAQYVAKAAALAINLYDPDRIILAGYVLHQCSDHICEQIEKAITTDVYESRIRKIEISTSKAGKLGHVKGAALAILKNSMEWS